MKQGWQPGSTLGQPESDGTALVEPLEVTVRKNRAGLGMAAMDNTDTLGGASMDWREAAKRRRFEDLRAGGE